MYKMDKEDRSEALKDIKSRVDYCLLHKAKEGVTIAPSVWSKMKKSPGCMKWIKKTLDPNLQEKEYDRIIAKLAYMAYGIMSTNANEIEPVETAKYEKKQARLRYREIFYFVQHFARGGKTITGDEYMSGKLLNLRRLNNVHPKQIKFSWSAVTEYWNNAHPGDIYTEPQFKELYYNAERAGTDRAYIVDSRQWIEDQRQDRLDLQIETMSELTDLSDCDINNPDHLEMLKAKWPQIQHWMRCEKQYREEKREAEYQQFIRNLPEGLQKWYKDNP